jgi:mRNA interferase HigB
MRVVNEQVIGRFVRKHPDCRGWLENWLRTVREAQWHSIVDVRRTYPAADGGVRVASGGQVTVFNVSGNKYRLVAVVVFVGETVVVLDVMTHAEYGRGHWKQRY